MPLGAKSAEKPRFGNPYALFKRKPFASGKKTLPLGIPIMHAG
jgi:hypothetical protein